jgi:N-acetylmuramic acid 6-phosphate etherase
MSTERSSPRYKDIDVWQPDDVLDAMIEGQLSAVAAVRAVRADVERAALAIEDRLRQRGRLIYVGAGTSGRLAVQDGAELMPTFSWPQDRLVLLMAGGHDALVQAVEGAEDEIEHAHKDVRQHGIGQKDAVIAIAASGTTPYTLACLRAAKERHALTIGVANNAGTPILEEADHKIFLDTGAEPIAGSTRMKAGTAQRVLLTVLSSLVMIRLGHVYDGLMVDLQATNKKLVRRSEEMLIHLTDCTREAARAALREAGGSVKLAVMLLNGCDVQEAKALLYQARGQLRGGLKLARRGRTRAA